MPKRKTAIWCVLLVCGVQLNGWTAIAAVSPEEAARLGGPELTPVGAERQGNAEGTIPPWTGGITEPPASFRPGTHHADPFADDSVLFTITAENLEQHADNLSEGQMALLRTYPDTWRMNVYPSRRSASYPEWVYEGIKANATRAELVTEGQGGVDNARVSSPFPIPGSAVEIIWNHNLRWRGIRIRRAEGTAAVTRRGNYTIILQEQDLGFPYGLAQEMQFNRKYPNLMVAGKTKIIQPAFLAGNGRLFLEPLNQTQVPRKAWVYQPALRRVVRAPFLAYGLPAPNTDSLRTVDEFELYNGAPDRFEWILHGKRELLIPYNTYRLHSASITAGDILRQSHIAPDLARYELHRVWVVEGRLREGARHVYSRRVFYIDEDSWQIAASESYDLAGKLWRTAEAHAVNYYDVPVHWTTLHVFYDLKAQRYLVEGLDNRRKPYRFLETADPREFSPGSLLYYVR